MEAAREVDERPRHDSTRVAAVVLTYDAPDALERCLTALDAQTAPLGAVLVTDNASSTPVDDVARRFARVDVQRLPENLGPAGGYAEALTAFLDTGFEWAWVMDDDCVPVPDALAEQLGIARTGRMVLPTVQWAETGEVVRGNGWWGALIHRSVIEAVGVPNPDLFWWTEDTEYLQWRIPESGVEVRWTARTVTRVSRGRADDAKPAWKYYYEARNQVYHRLYVQRARPTAVKPLPHHLKIGVRSWRAARGRHAHDAGCRPRTRRPRPEAHVDRAWGDRRGPWAPRRYRRAGHSPSALDPEGRGTRSGAVTVKQGAVFVMPRRSTEWADAPGIWITAAGWAEAAQRRLGHAWVVTRDRVATPRETVAFTEPLPRTHSTFRDVPAPLVVRTAAKDALRGWEAWKARDAGEQMQWRDIELAFVWQHHDLFHFAGEPLARRHHVPLVSYVHAPQVWEGTRWGVQRPGWATGLERFGDRPPLMRSDVVACVSEEVADEVVRLDVDRERVIVSPMAVDARRFSPMVSGKNARTDFGITDEFVVGWTGSFRKFHGLDVALEAFTALTRRASACKLLLVGDGPERSAIERTARTLGIGDQVVFAGATAHEDLPALVAAMDVAVVTALDAEAFHYSPQKMREYLACSRAVVAPRVGDIARTVTDRVDALLYDAGDVAGFTDRLLELRDDRELCGDLGRAGRELMERTGTWEVRLEQLLASEPFRRAPGGRRVIDGFDDVPSD